MICDTCGYEFQPSGYKRHLTSTSNPKCRAKGAQLNPGFRQRRSTPEVQAEMLDLHFRGAPFAQRGIELQPIASDEEELPGLRDEIVESARDDVAAGPSSIPPGRRDMLGEVHESDVLVGVSADATGEDVERMEELEASQNRRHNGFEDPGYVSEPHSEDDSDEDEWEDCSSSEDEEDEGEETENSSDSELPEESIFPKDPEPDQREDSAEPNQEQTSAGSPKPPEAGRDYVEASLRQGVNVKRFTSSKYPNVGRPVPYTTGLPAHIEYKKRLKHEDDSLYWPFRSRLDYLIAHWAKTQGPSGNSLNAFLGIPGVVETLDLSFKTTTELNKTLDNLPSGRPPFVSRNVEVDGATYEIWYRDIIACVRALFSNAEFARYLVFLPEKHYEKGADGKRGMRLYHDLHTGRWWWQAQEHVSSLHDNAMVIPIILSSDKTRVTNFGTKTVYPVYMTIGNLPKEIRRKSSRQGYVLLGYIPVTRLEHIKQDEARRRSSLNLFHAALGVMTEPLIAAGSLGIDIATSEGHVYHGYPLLAIYIGDYPEQVTVACITQNKCLRCKIPRGQLGSHIVAESRSMAEALIALDSYSIENIQAFRNFTAHCEAADIKPVPRPFWLDLPFVDIFNCMTPDVLHQLHQGLIKYLVRWITEVFDDDELDRRCKTLPKNQHVRHFFSGMSHLSRLTGRDHANLARVIPGLISGMRMSEEHSGPLARAMSGLLDFFYLAQYAIHSDGTLQEMRAALDRFHANKYVFVTLGVRKNFELPKLHWADHYLECIRAFGTTDNYNTEYTERLHIDYAKNAYRASNRKDEMRQMTTWMNRKEKLNRFGQHIAHELHESRQWEILQEQAALNRRDDEQRQTVPDENGNQNQPPARDDEQRQTVPDENGNQNQPPARDGQDTNTPAATRVDAVGTTESVQQPDRPRIKMTKHATRDAVPVQDIRRYYGALRFETALREFSLRYTHPELSNQEVLDTARQLSLPRISTIAVYHKARIWLGDKNHYAVGIHEDDVIHAHPRGLDAQLQPTAGRFDPVIVNLGQGSHLGVNGHRAARVKVIFSLNKNGYDSLFTVLRPGPRYMAYVEWYTPFDPESKDPNHGMYKISKTRQKGTRIKQPGSSIIPLENITRSAHLLPIYEEADSQNWTSDNVLDMCNHFHVNRFSDINAHRTLF